MQFDAVEAGLSGPYRAVDELLLAFVDLFVGKILNGLFPACADRLLYVVDELDRHFAAFGVHGVRHLFESGDEFVVADAEEVGTLSVEHAAGFDVDKAEAPLRARHVAFDERVCDEADLVGETGDGGKPYEAVSQFQVSKFYRLQYFHSHNIFLQF